MAWHCRPVVLVIAASLAVSGCASDPGATPAQARLRQQAGAGTGWTTAAGCAAGTFLGAGLGALLAGQHDRGKGALWGGSLGAAAGCASGYYVASTNDRYASEQDALRARIDAADEEIAQTRQSVADANRVVAEHQAAIDRLDRQYKAGTATSQAYAQQAKSAQADAGAIKTLIQQTQQSVSAMQQDIDRLRADNVDTMSLQNQRTALQQQEAALQDQYNELVAMMAKMPPEMRKPVT